jgi:hypothetical protein
VYDLSPNQAFERSAQQPRCWVPSSLRSSAPAQRRRWTHMGSEAITIKA